MSISDNFKRKAAGWRAEASAVLSDRLAVHALKIPAEMRSGMDRLDHEAEESFLQARLNAVSKGGVWGTIVAVDALLTEGREIKLAPAPR